MTEQTHINTLQRTLNEYRQEKRRIQAKIDELERDMAHYRGQFATFDSMIKQTESALQDALELHSEPFDASASYDSRREPRRDSRYDEPRREPRRDSRYDEPRRDPRYDEPRRDPRYDEPRRDPRYDEPRHDQPSYRPGAPYRSTEPLSPYRQPEPIRAADLDEAVEHLHRDEMRSNVRFADFRIPQAATIVLREAEGPLHVSDIYQRLAEGGFEFRGQHQLITLAVSLSRSKRFRKVAPGTFELDPAYRAGQVA
ncbi:MAG: hypothetical protein KIT57_06885 [Blastocatellales bacterium]|nr:hypothetical protein [Blastocatellales bacterium]